MADQLEGTDEFNRQHVVAIDSKVDMFTKAMRLGQDDDDPAPYPINGAAMDPFEDDELLTCGLENPESCESCQ